jgi:hypothetical protein
MLGLLSYGRVLIIKEEDCFAEIVQVSTNIDTSFGRCGDVLFSACGALKSNYVKRVGVPYIAVIALCSLVY